MKDLFLGTGIAHSIMLFAFVIATGLALGKVKIKGVSIGSTWILFISIIMSHFGFVANPTVLSFMKDFGLILFVFSIGLQVGPGFFHSFKSGGVQMNLLAVFMIALAVVVTVAIHFATGESLRTMTGVMSGAVTNTPGLGAAQQTLSDSLVAGGVDSASAAAQSSSLASAYAVAYPLGVLGVLFLIILAKGIFKIDLDKEKAELDKAGDSGESARRMHCEVRNPAIFGKSIGEALCGAQEHIVISRLMRDGEISIPEVDTTLQEGDKLLIVTSQNQVDKVRIIFGEEIPMHVEEWRRMSKNLVTRRITVTKHSITGSSLKNLRIRSAYDVTVTRVVRAGVELVARPGLILQVGDILQVVGAEDDIKAVGDLVGNSVESLNKPNLVPIFFGIVLGVFFGSLPIRFPGIPQPVKLGLAGGPLIIAILLGYFGPKWKITTYTTLSANMMIREIGISFFMAAVGLGAGQNFVSSILGGGYWWILYGFLITVIPVGTTILLARLVFKLNFYKICGLVSGGTTDPAVLAFAQGAYGTDYTSVNYATVYPLTMFMRVLSAQLLILFTL
ncbi:MAG: putative transporter [Bacteroidales bacterium]|nr:putative transporter [Bacteroidales bacterium]